MIFPGERPLHALRERGVEYIEVRLMDLDPFVPVGIAASTMRFLDVFLLHCLLRESPPDTPAEIADLARNQHLTAARGREPGLELLRDGRPVALTAWGAEILDECEPVAAALDAAHGNTLYSEALRAARQSLEQPHTLPSARVLEAMTTRHQNSFVAFARAQSKATRGHFSAMPLPQDLRTRFEQLAARSIADQKEIEANDSMPFEIYLEQYLSPARLGLSQRAKAKLAAA